MGSVPRRATPYLTGDEQLRLAWGQPLDGDSDGFPLLSSGKPPLNASESHNHSVARADAASLKRFMVAFAAAAKSNNNHQSKPVKEWVVQRQ